jgi:hypothetical protein
LEDLAGAYYIVTNDGSTAAKGAKWKQNGGHRENVRSVRWAVQLVKTQYRQDNEKLTSQAVGQN